MKNFTRLAVIAMFVIGGAVILFGMVIGSLSSARGSKIADCLKARASASSTFSIADCEGGSWDHLLIVTPYLDPDAVARSHGVTMPWWIRTYGIDSNDGICLLVFVRDGKAIASAEVARPLDFFTLEKAYIPRAEAKFRVSKRADSEWLGVHLAE